MKSKKKYSFVGMREVAAQALGVKESLVTRFPIRYRARKGSLIRENVFVVRADVLKLLALETITHKKLAMNTSVKVFAPSRAGVRTLSDKGLLTMERGR